MEKVKDLKLNFYNPLDFAEDYKVPKKDKKILITIDDAFSSFYEYAWPYLKNNKIPFILFVSTEPVGKRGYMTWEQIKEVEKEIYLLRKKAPEKINKIAIDTSSELVKRLIGAEVNNSSISAIVDDLSKKNGDKYYGN